MSFTLDDIITAAEKKYGSYDIEHGEETLHLRNVLKLSKAERKELAALQTKLTTNEINENADKSEDEEEIDEEKILKDIIKLLAHNKTLATAVLKSIGDRLDVLLHIYISWNEGTEAGEAPASQN